MWNEAMIKSFLVLADAGSFSEAARRSYFSQQAISKQIAHLEAELHAVLVRRHHGGIELTPEGEVYRQAFKQVMRIMEQTETEVSRMTTGKAVTIRIGYLERLVDPVWMEYVEQFRRENPDIRIEINVYADPDIVDALINDRIDAAFLLNPNMVLSEDIPLHVIPVGMGGNAQLCVSRHLPGAEAAESYRDLLHLPVFMPDRNEPEAKNRMLQMGFPLENIDYRANITSAVLAVKMLQGSMMVSKYCDLYSDPELLFFEIPYFESGAKLVWRQDNVNRALHRMMEQFCASCGQHIEKQYGLPPAGR